MAPRPSGGRGCEHIMSDYVPNLALYQRLRGNANIGIDFRFLRLGDDLGTQEIRQKIYPREEGHAYRFRAPRH
jgi:hypothetical protein